MGATPTTQAVFVQNLAAGTITAQSPTVSGEEPALSLGGTRIAYVSRLEPDKELYAQTVNVDGSRVRLTDNTLDDMMPAFAPSGDIYFIRAHSGTQWDIWRMSGTGASPARITDRDTRKVSPVVSRDGLNLAFWELVGGVYQLKIRRISDGAETVIVPSAPVSDPLPSVEWFSNEALLASSLVGGVQRVFSIRADGSDRRDIVDGFRPHRSRDGQRIMFGRMVGGGMQAFTSTLGGASVSQYTVAPGQVSTGWDWSQD